MELFCLFPCLNCYTEYCHIFHKVILGISPLKYKLGFILDPYQKSCLCHMLEIFVTVDQYHVR